MPEGILFYTVKPLMPFWFPCSIPHGRAELDAAGFIRAEENGRAELDAAGFIRAEENDKRAQS